MVQVLTLPSDSSMDWYPDNKISQFRVHLAHEIVLDGPHEVGLVSLSYPHSWHTVEHEQLDSHVGIFSEDGSFRIFKTAFNVVSGYYPTPEDLVRSINKSIQDVLRVELPDLADVRHITLVYNPVTQMVKVRKEGGTTAMDVHFKLHPQLLFKLGFIDPVSSDRVRYLKKGDRGSTVVDLSSGRSHIYVNCSIAAERPVGHTLQPLLRCVPISGKQGDMVVYEPKIIDWIPVKTSTIRTVTVYLNDDIGRFIPFERGKCVVTLHLRKQRFLD